MSGSEEAAPESGGGRLLAHFDETTIDSTTATPLTPHPTTETFLTENGDRDVHPLATPVIKLEDDTSAAPQIPANDNTTASTLRPEPVPSAKRRESEVTAADFSEPDRLNGKKRKRGTSPPWQFPSVENPTLKTADGRRVSARFNTDTPTLSENNGGRDRSSSLSAPPARLSRPPSPPWKRFGVEGPTSLVVDGKRKSGRVNRELTEPPKRVSPRSKKQVGGGGGEHVNGVQRPTSKSGSSSHKAETTTPAKNHPQDSSRPSTSTMSDSSARIAELRAQIDALKPVRSFPSPEQPPKRSHKRKRSNNAAPAQHDGPSSPPATHRKPPRPHNASLSPEMQRPSPKIKLRLNAPRRVVPPPHPNAKVPSLTLPPSLSIFQKIEEYELKELQQPYSENERGPPDMAWFLQRAERQAVEESVVRKKILNGAQPGGALSKERLSIYQDADPQPEPPRQHGHYDHLVAHALHLRHLQLREKTHHRQLAKKVAHEALEFWKMKRGPTEEDLREELDKVFRLIYKQVVVDVKAKWEMVAAHVQHERLRLWEAEEELRRQARLQEKLEWSENMVARQRGETGEDSEEEDGSDDGMEGGEGSDEDSEEENMSEGSSEASGQEEEEGTGEMDDDELATYLAQRGVEPPDKLESEDEGDGDEPLMEDENGDVSMAEASDEPSAQDNPTMRVLIDEGQPDEEVDEEFQPKDAESVENIRSAVHVVQQPARRSRRSSASPAAADENADEADFSSDESTNMDSTDYDSDEDMSSTGDEDNADHEDEEGSSDGDETADWAVKQNPLLSLFKDEIKNFGLPTPTTSAEGDERDHHAESGVDEQAEAGAANLHSEVVGATAGSKDDIQESEPEPSDAKMDEVAPMCENEESTTPASVDSHVATPPARASPAAESIEEDQDDSATKHLVPSPALLRGTLRSYQHAGLDWLASLYRNGTNGILADEMGLGKTIQTIALLAHLAEEHECWDSHLVIVPTSVVLNWVTEFQKFLPGFRVLAYYGSAEERQAKRRGWVNDPHHENREKRGYNVVITSYNVAMQDINAIRNVQWHYLVLDEAHNIRNFNSQRWQVLIRLKTRARLLLTGTPLQNSLAELWSLLTFLTAGDDDPAHGDLEEFLSHWKEPVKEIFDRGVVTLSTEAQKVVEQLHVSLRPFLLRRLKSEVEKDLPKKTEMVVVCKLSKRQRQLYQDYMGLADTRKGLTQGNAVTAGKVLLSLRRVCNHPDLFDPRPIQTSFAMEMSALEAEGLKEVVVRRLLGVQENKSSTTPRSLLLVANEGSRKYAVKRAKQLSASNRLQNEAQGLESQCAEPDISTIAGCQALQRVRLRQRKLEHLRSCIRTSEDSLQAAPVYGSDLRELLTLRTDRPYRVTVKDSKDRVVGRPLHAWPALGRRPLRFDLDHMSDWLLSRTSRLQESVQTAESYAESLNETIVKFAFCTPAVTAPILNYSIPTRTQEFFRASDSYPIECDYAHEARIRNSIAFPDSRLLIFDSGKLQRLSRLLRDLQSRGSRSLVFTQMTGTLNILEQFLNLLNLPYLRLDGSTPVERRQLYSAEFNRPDSKYQCMILSSRAGGIGLNLTGASSVIFYDLDWNPQMDRQCMDRAHRIGQVRDVEVYKMVSEKTVEENILRRANQKSLLDQTVIQEGHFTTEHQQPRHVEQEEGGEDDEDDVAAAIERFLGGGNEKSTTQALESVEDKEDVQAAQQARKEEHQDDADFADRSSKGPSVPPTPGGHAADEDEDADEDAERKGHLDLYMVRQMERLLKDVPFVPPQVRRTDRHGRDPGHRAKRKR